MTVKHMNGNGMVRWWHLPIILMLGIYLPASLLGLYVFRDKYSTQFLVLLVLFGILYYGLFGRFAAMVQSRRIRSFFWSIGDRVPWTMLAWVAVGVYLLTLTIAVLTVPETPLGAALRGGDWLDVSIARGNLYANRQGPEAILRYLGLILGRSVLPFLLACLFLKNHRFRYWALAGLLGCYSISLEKASPIFAFLPLVLLFVSRGKSRQALGLVFACVLCIATWTFVSTGGLHKTVSKHDYLSSAVVRQIDSVESSPIGFSIGRRGDPQRHYFFNYIKAMGVPFDFSTTGTDAIGKLMIMTNRCLWIPYVTAYDWLKFHDEILGGALTMGQSIGVVSWLMKKPKILLEQMVYEYEFGVPPGGAGASNTVFLVDAKLAFGWLGSLSYCIIFTFCSAVIFSSLNQAAKLASVTSFFTATLSPLTATLLSGGLFFFMLMALLQRSSNIDAEVWR